MRKSMVVAYLCLSLFLVGCLMSHQEGTLKSGYPGHNVQTEMSFHFNTTYNWVMVIVVTVMTLLPGIWFLRLGAGASNKVLILVGAAIILAGVFVGGNQFLKVRHCHIDLKKDGLYIGYRSSKETVIPWDQVRSLSVEGMAWKGGSNISLYKWEEMEIHTKTKGTTHVNLSDFSIEQRHTIFRGIAQFAGLEVVIS